MMVMLSPEVPRFGLYFTRNDEQNLEPALITCTKYTDLLLLKRTKRHHHASGVVLFTMHFSSIQLRSDGR